MKYLIDTDRIINHLRGVEKVTKELVKLVPEGLALSIISLAELYEGVYRSTDPARTEESLWKFLTGVTILEIDEEICRVFGRERTELREEGKLIGDLDLLIASTCLHHNLILLTDNIREFERVKNLKILKDFGQ